MAPAATVVKVAALEEWSFNAVQPRMQSARRPRRTTSHGQIELVADEVLQYFDPGFHDAHQNDHNVILVLRPKTAGFDNSGFPPTLT